jgi:hypothetical protein
MITVVAIFGAWIAFSQWWLAQKRLKMDLFDRRWRVYAAYQKLFWILVKQRKAEQHQFDEFVEDAAGAEWLFDQAVANFLFDFRSQAAFITLHTSKVEAPGAVGAEARTEYGKVNLEMINKVTVAAKLFGPYMHIDAPLPVAIVNGIRKFTMAYKSIKDQRKAVESI